MHFFRHHTEPGFAAGFLAQKDLNAGVSSHPAWPLIWQITIQPFETLDQRRNRFKIGMFK